MIRHFGVFEFQEHITAAQIETVFTTMHSMVGQIEGLQSMEFGPYSSTEGLNGNFTHGFLMTFTDASARDIYLDHPIHTKVKEFVVPHLKNYIVFDINSAG